MADFDISTEQDLLAAIEEGLQQGFGGAGMGMGQGADAMHEAKRESLDEMTKALPSWSLEPPETFLA